jgi:hypothetical protein
MSDSVQARRRTTWRIVASLMCLGLAANVTFGMLFATGVSTTVPYGVADVSRWLPPSVERLSPMLQAMRRLGAHSLVAFGYLAFSTIVSMVIAVALWKMKKWAAWIMTFLMLYTLGASTCRIVLLTKMGLLNSNELVTFGWIPALAWSTAYVVLLWPDQIVDGLREGANAIKQLRRERIPLG